MLQYLSSNHPSCSSEVFGDDVGHHDCFTVPVLGFADIIPKVDGLHVLDGQDGLGHSRRLARASLNQPPGGMSVNWAPVLHNKSTSYFHNAT